MTIPRSVGEVLADHVTLEVESIDRLYLNLYVPILQSERGVAFFWRHHRGYQFASSALMAPMSKGFIANIERFASEERIDLISFRKGQRKEDVAKEYLAKFPPEKARLFDPIRMARLRANKVQGPPPSLLWYGLELHEGVFTLDARDNYLEYVKQAST